MVDVTPLVPIGALPAFSLTIEMDIRPVAEVEREQVHSYLRERGLGREIVEWKYFDSGFNRGRLRGYCWIRNGRVSGFLGIVPFTLDRAGTRQAAAWTCDWSVRDPQKNPGAGILLLRHAIETHDRLFAFGGNETTQRLLPRLARQTFPSAGVTLHLPLRTGFLQRALSGRLPTPPSVLRPALRAAGALPLRWRFPTPTTRIEMQEGLPDDLEALLLELPREVGVGQVHDATFLRWQLEDCPTLRCWSFLAPRDEPPRALVLCWHSSESPKYWRLVLLGDAGSRQGKDTISAALEAIRRTGAYAVSTIVSERSADSLALMRSSGFLKARARKPLFACALPAGEELDGPFTELSHFAADLAHRF